MAFIRIRRPWEIPESQVVSEQAWLDRRRLLKGIGASALAALTGCDSGPAPEVGVPDPNSPDVKLYPAKRNPKYDKVENPITDERRAAEYTNFYEFTQRKNVHLYVEKFQPRPWKVKVHGLVEKPQTFDIEDLVRLAPLEERVYRFRCVETWSMVVPWTGFPLAALLNKVKPLSAAKYVRFVTFLNPEQAPNQNNGQFEWPYYEGLTLAEAAHELTLLTTGIYGHELPKQHGAPVRLVVPWKFGYKSIKSIVEIELVAGRPPTFWNDLAPHMYDFSSNVSPDYTKTPWSQRNERLLDTGAFQPTVIYNGYGEQVAGLYE